ncbi:NAD-P-binding protein [Sparassis latifolia]|uniref:Zinc-type alcohol dehydrogenase-like protein n=1 Tax=Sparassis crispa TaxID=139825 RepID=A0A401G4R0_9APHY|nr:Zinc-type alcohol dehydrogenase-like protein [Sparassis crispa]GBE77140.1 Zinc-type alcohol dehydrogenase-like protein [Sparassis crispa]
MPIPTTTREYRLHKTDSFQSLVIQEAPVRPPKSSEVLVKIHAVSLQHRDLALSTGKYSFPHKENVVPCSDMAGEILAVGDEVKGWNVGDRVCANFSLDHLYGPVTIDTQMTALGAPIDGVLTEYRLFPAHSLVRIPEHLSYEEASTLPCAGLTAYNALFGGFSVKGGDTVLIQGTGGVSIFGLQFAVASGVTAIVTSSSDEKLKIAAQLGAKHLINYKKTPDWEKEVLKITNGEGVNHIIEVGGEGTMVKSAQCIASGGSIDLIGLLAGRADVSSVPIMLLRRCAMMRGLIVGSRSQFEAMNRFIAAIGLKPVVNKVFPFEQAREAYAYLESQKHIGKVVIKVSKD